MIKTIARGLFLFTLAVMIATWAVTIVNSEPASQEQQLPTDRMYS